MGPAARHGSAGPRSRRSGLLPSYWDATGRLRRIAPATLQRLGSALDAGAPSGPPAALPPVVLLPAGSVVRRTLGPRGGDGDLRPHLTVRRAGTRRWRSVPWARPGRVTFPATLPVGCHEARLRIGATTTDHLLVVHPPRIPATPGRRWGFFAPLYALRTPGAWGCGDLTSLEALGRWAASVGATVVATLPLLPAFLGTPFEPSPYRPVSRRFWNEVYLDPTRTPEFRRSSAVRRWVASPGFRRRVAALERREHVDFRGVARLKRAVLERLLGEFARAPPARRAAFRRFVARTEELDEYARVRARSEPRPRRGREYHRFAQWLIEEQIRTVATRLRRRGVDLCFDLPLGVHPDGLDARRDAPLYAPGVQTGSPPDPGAPDGQVWGFAPWAPEPLRRAGYRPFVAALRHPLSVARYLRIDHVLGFHRQFWVPDGSSAREGAYVRYPVRELYAIVVAEAARAGATVIGEDLGTVPPEVRPALARHGLLGLYVAELEWDGPDHRPIRRGVVAAVDTHDQPPFRAYWNRCAADGRRSRAPDAFPFVALPPRAAFRRTVLELAASRARLLLVNLEDLWGETRVQNVPGEAGAGATHFTRRFRRSLPELEADAATGELLCAIGSLRPRRHAPWARPTAPNRPPLAAARRSRRRRR